MEAVAAILTTPAGQMLVSAGVNQALAVAGGADPAQAALAFQQAVESWSTAAAAFKTADDAASKVGV